MDKFDTTTRTEAKAPNLKPAVHIESPNFICCTEAYQVPKPKPCEGSINCPPLPQLHCLHKTAPCPKRISKPSGLHERDILFRPIRWRCKESTKVPDPRNEPSLGAPIGLSKSSFNIKFLETASTEQSLQAFATLLVAFAEYFITPEIEWDEKVINRILLEGQRLYADSKIDLSEGEQVQERTIKRSFVLCKNAFHVMVNDAFLIGHVVGKELPVPNLHWGLYKFFRKFQFCLLQIGSWYILLWKNADVYFVFDCIGRRTQDFQSDPRQGLAMLICLRSLDNVSHLVVNLSGIQHDQLFTIRHLQVKSLIPCGNQPLPDIVDRSVQFEVIAPDYALLGGTIHLGSECFKEIRHRQSLPVAMCALINAKVDATPTWDSAVLDKIIKLGTEFYKQWTRRCDVSFDLGIQDVPRRFSFGQFIVQIAVDPKSECGLWKCTPNYRHTELTAALKKAFGRGSNLIIQIQGRCYAIWKKREFYYVMDPYSHRCSLEKKKIVTASLRMCATIDRLCCIVTQALLELFEESTFLIHLVQILQVEDLGKIDENRLRAQTPCRCLATAQVESAHEVMSLNESVLGPDDFECAAEPSPLESDSADLDSPGLSQAYLEDYTDLRRDFMDDSSSEESEEEEEDDIDLDAVSVGMPPSAESDDEDDDGPPSQPAPRKKPKKSKNSCEREKKSKAAGGTSEAKDGNRRGSKRGHETANDDADDEMDKSKKESKKPRKKDKNDYKDDKMPKTTEGKPKELDGKGKDQVDKGEKSKSKPEKNGKEDVTNEKVQRTAEKDKRFGQSESPSKDTEPNKEDTEPTIDNSRVADNDKNENKNGGDKSPPQIDQDAPPPDHTGSKGERPNNRQSKEPLPATKTTFRRQRHQRRKEQDGDDNSSDENPRAGIPVGCKPNSYPGFTEDPQDLAVVGSENGSYDSLCSLLKSAFHCADRVLTMTPWGNYITFYSNKVYFIFDGCTCNLRSIRHMDISVGTAGLLCFPDMHSLIRYIESGKETPRPTMSSKRNVVNQICSEYCGRRNK